MANRNFSSAGKLYSMHTMPVLLDCNFIVDSTNGNGLGIRSLKGPTIQNVFMHTSQTPGLGNSNPASPNVAVTNPNPAAGTIVIQFQDNFNRLLGGSYSLVSPVGSSIKIDNSAMTAGVAYVITVLGDASAAKWQAIGVPKGVTPAVGVAFIAASDGGSANTSTSRVAPSAANGTEILQIETVGNSNLSIAPDPTASQGFGAQIILQTRNDSSSDHSAIVTPADGSVIQLSFLLSNSSVQVQGE